MRFRQKPSSTSDASGIRTCRLESPKGASAMKDMSRAHVLHTM